MNTKSQRASLAIVIVALILAAAAHAGGWGPWSSGSSFNGTVGAAGITFSPGGLNLASGGANTVLTSGIVRADQGFWMGGVCASVTPSGYAASACSAAASMRQMQSAVKTADIGGTVSAAGDVAVRIGTTVADGSSGNLADLLVLSTDEDGTPTNKFRFKGTGVMQTLAQISASNALAATEACAAAGDVGKEVIYSDTSTSKISKCLCEQTGAGTFAWGAATATGDCT